MCYKRRFGPDEDVIKNRKTTESATDGQDVGDGCVVTGREGMEDEHVKSVEETSCLELGLVGSKASSCANRAFDLRGNAGITPDVLHGGPREGGSCTH